MCLGPCPDDLLCPPQLGTVLKRRRKREQSALLPQPGGVAVDDVKNQHALWVNVLHKIAPPKLTEEAGRPLWPERRRPTALGRPDNSPALSLSSVPFSALSFPESDS